MDSKIVAAILRNSDDVVKDIEKSDEYQKLSSNDKLIPTSDVIPNALGTSLTHLLCHKVSKEAYQRYSVRLHVINVLRNWCRVSDAFQPLHVFTNEKHTLNFATKLINKHLSHETLRNCDNIDALIALSSALVCLLPKNPCLLGNVEKLIIRLTQSEETEECEQFLCYVVQNHADLHLGKSIIEQIYVSQKCKLIEEPLLNGLMYTNAYKDNKDSTQLTVVDSMNNVIEHAAQFPSIFQIVSNFLKELFIHLDGSPTVAVYTESILKQIMAYCELQNKNILDLYPKQLHYCIVMLRIEPYDHSSNSKQYTLNALHEIFVKSKDSALILLLHFPLWLQVYSDFKKTIEDIPGDEGVMTL